MPALVSLWDGSGRLYRCASIRASTICTCTVIATEGRFEREIRPSNSRRGLSKMRKNRLLENLKLHAFAGVRMFSLCMIFAVGLKWLADNTPKGWPFIVAASIFLALLGVAIIYTGRVQERMLEKLEEPYD